MLGSLLKTSPAVSSLLRFGVFGEVYDDCFQVVQPGFCEGFRTALSSGDVSTAWSVWPFSAVEYLVSAFLSAGSHPVRVLSAVVVQLGSDRSSLVVLWLGEGRG